MMNKLRLLLLATVVALPSLCAEDKAFSLDTGSAIERIFGVWKVKKNSQSLMSLDKDGAISYLHLVTTTPLNAILNHDASIPEGSTAVVVEYTIRVPAVTVGEKSYQVPRIAVQWDNDPTFQKQVVTHFKKVIPEWTSNTVTVPIPEGAKTVQFHMGILNTTATFDVAKLNVSFK